MHTHLPIAIANIIGEPKDAEQVDVTFHGRGDPTQGDASGGGNVREACREASGDGMQQELDWRGTVVRPYKDRWVIGVVREWDRAGRVLLSGAVKALDG
jgi:hypothetical protein